MNLHQFWFENIELTESYYARQIKRWFFRNDPDFDKQCEEFLSLKTDDPLLQILLYDQLPRNVYRGSARAYEWDRKAQELTLSLLDTSFEKKLSLPERIFFYMPLQHAEDLKRQELSVEKFFELHKEAPFEIREWTHLGLKKALEHLETIRVHGRFPSRPRSENYLQSEGRIR